MVITKEQIEILRNYVQNADELINLPLEKLLDELDTAMLESMDGENFEIETEDSIKLAKIYDQLLAQNKED